MYTIKKNLFFPLSSVPKHIHLLNKKPQYDTNVEIPKFHHATC